MGFLASNWRAAERSGCLCFLRGFRGMKVGESVEGIRVHRSGFLCLGFSVYRGPGIFFGKYTTMGTQRSPYMDPKGP